MKNKNYFSLFLLNFLIISLFFNHCKAPPKGKGLGNMAKNLIRNNQEGKRANRKNNFEGTEVEIYF